MANPNVEEPPSNESDQYVYVTAYRNKAGKLMVAAHYGYKAWRFPVRKPKPRKTKS